MFILLLQEPSPRCTACFIKKLHLFGQLCALQTPSWEGGGRQRRAQPCWPIACSPSRRQAVTPWSAGFRTGLGGAFTSLIHSPGKARCHLPNLVSEKSGSLIALYSLVNDIFKGLIKINLDTSYKAGTMKWKSAQKPPSYLGPARTDRAKCAQRKGLLPCGAGHAHRPCRGPSCSCHRHRSLNRRLGSRKSCLLRGF